MWRVRWIVRTKPYSVKLLSHALSVLIVGLAGCANTVTIQHPSRLNPPAFFSTGPVPCVVTWTGDMQAGSFFVKLDGADITPKFTVNVATREAQAVLQNVGADAHHTLEAGGSLPDLSGGYSTTSDIVQFDVGPNRFCYPGCTGVGSVCQNGVCGCAAPTASCGGKCVFIDRDDNNCGACGTMCKSGAHCSFGFCNILGPKQCAPPSAIPTQDSAPLIAVRQHRDCARLSGGLVNA
jgi:hypothetical protein